MESQQFIQARPDNRSSKEISPANRVYRFRDLPQEIQERLLNLQNTPGDFLKLGDRRLLLWTILLGFFLFALFIFAVACVASGLNLETTFSMFFGSGIFLIWIFYFSWRIYKTVRSPLKNRVYLTPTQMIETNDGYVRYRELKDVSAVEFRTVRVRGGKNYILIFRLNDHDSFKYPFLIGAFSSKGHEAESWQEKAVMWRNYAVNAFQRGDAAYFNSWNIFQGLSESNTIARRKKTGVVPVIALLLITLMLPVMGFVSFVMIGSGINENKIWDWATAENNVSNYLYYLKKHPGGRHVKEAAQKINGFYDEASKKIKEKQATAPDAKGAETALNLLESAKVKQDNEVTLNLTAGSYDIKEIVRSKISMQFNKMFPAKTLFIEDKDRGAAYINSRVSVMEVKITPAVERAKSPTKNSSFDTANAPETKYDFNCIIGVPDKPKYEFEMKSATVEEFNNELARRFAISY